MQKSKIYMISYDLNLEFHHINYWTHNLFNCELFPFDSVVYLQLQSEPPSQAQLNGLQFISSHHNGGRQCAES